MTPAQRRYRRTEAMIGAAINAVLSLGFGLLVFGGSGRVAIPALVFDTMPQSFMVTLMSVAVPTMLTRRRIAAGVVSRFPTGHAGRWPRPVAARALVAATVVATLGWALGAVFLPAMLTIPPALLPTLAAKVVFGAVLGAVVTAIAVSVELSTGLEAVGPSAEP